MKKYKYFQILAVIVSLSCFQNLSAEDLSVTDKAQAAAKQWLQSKNYQESEYFIKPICKKSYCEISIFSSDYNGKDPSIMGCLAKFCVTMKYDVKLNKINDVVHIR